LKPQKKKKKPVNTRLTPYITPVEPQPYNRIYNQKTLYHRPNEIRASINYDPHGVGSPLTEKMLESISKLTKQWTVTCT